MLKQFDKSFKKFKKDFSLLFEYGEMGWNLMNKFIEFCLKVVGVTAGVTVVVFVANVTNVYDLTSEASTTSSSAQNTTVNHNYHIDQGDGSTVTLTGLSSGASVENVSGHTTSAAAEMASQSEFDLN